MKSSILIDGEGKSTRAINHIYAFHDCNIRCSYCDTTHSYAVLIVSHRHDRPRGGIDAIEGLGNHRITITGGEPLLQEVAVVELIDELNHRKIC